ncbi:MAG: hypothetical protein IPM96_20620 [Ignavibacteria bacterium]|nr:hypothetical protein [Ignavibacteria bacterium]
MLWEKRQTVFRTTDRGNTWNVRYLSWGFPLYDISFIDHNTGFLTGEYGVIIKTTNSGISWTYLNRFTPNNLKSICFISQDTGFSVSTLSGSEGKIFRTINGGDKWSLLSDLNIFIYKINFIDKLTGFVTCEGGNIFKTTNAGETWISKISGCMNANLVSIDFISADTGFAVGSKSLLLKTTNGGDEWRKMNCPINSNYIYVKFFDNENGYLAGTTLYKTTNSGISWDNIANLNGLDDIIFYNIDTGYYMKNDILFKTFNGETTGHQAKWNLLLKNSISLKTRIQVFTLPHITRYIQVILTLMIFIKLRITVQTGLSLQDSLMPMAADISTQYILLTVRQDFFQVHRELKNNRRRSKLEHIPRSEWIFRKIIF